MLEKALLRIKLPKVTIDLIINLFKSRKLRIITDYGLTNEITAGDGIDQGEIISPLLWRIFYDPLLCKINNNKHYGYIMHSSWRPDVRFPITKSLTVRTACLAYMDDTTWIASSKSDLQAILNDANQFYYANDSQINGSKSQIIAVNFKGEKETNPIYIGQDRVEVYATSKYEFVRFLGVWMMNSYLNSSTCKRLTAKYSQTFKNSIQVTRTVPNSAIRHPGIYNLKSISELQNESQINGLIHRLNDAGSVGTSTFIRLEDIQLLNWESTNILINDKIKLNVNNNLSGQILNIAHSLGINFQGPRIQELFQWKGGNFPIKIVLNNDKLYKSSVKSLRRRHLLFLDQIIDTHNNIILKWPMIGVFTNVSRGKQPNWYKLIDNMIVDPTNPPKLSSLWSSNTYIDPHYPWTQPLNKKRSVRDWVGYFDPVESTYIWDHITYKPNYNTDTDTTFKINHYIENQSEQFSLLPCLGCNKSEFNTNNNTSCSFSISSDLVPVAITGLMKLKGAQWKFKLPCNFSSIKNHIYNQYNTPTINLLPTIVIPQVPEITLINKFIVSQHYNTLLSIALRNNLSTQCLEFYSDGSLIKQSTQQMCMGSAWIQTSGPQLLSSFSCGVSSWPSSSHAGVIAIFIALLTAPLQYKVKINTDSQTCIDTFKHITIRSLTIRQWLRINNYLVWLRILETINTKSLLVLLFKVKAHSGVTFNKQADRLAKDALNLEPIQFNIIDTGPLSAIPTWDKFSSQNRIKKLLTDDPLDHNKRTFLFKLIHNELPTLDHPHYPWTQPLNKKRSVRDWVGYFDPVESTYIWDHITYKPNYNTDTDTTFKINHYIENQSEQFSLLPCLGCNKSEFNTNNNTSCSFSISSDLVPVAITGLMKLKGAQWKFKLPCNFSSIKNHIYNQYNTPTINLLPTIVIPQVPEITLINKFIVSQHYNTLLSIALRNNLSTQCLEFYSDGSLIKQSTQQMCMGSAWIQTSGPQLLSSFSCGVSSWPSSSHAGVIAIFIALLTAPLQYKVKINTDSQTCIDTFKHITIRSLTIRQWLRINNYLVWLRILETINTKSLLVLLFKVKAHSGVTFNKQADRLAKDALNLEPIQFNIIDTGPLSAIPTWDKFSSQNRIKKLLTDDPLDHNKRTFLFKLIHNELPTLDRLAIRQPKVYSSFTICPLCHLTEENIKHLFLCPQTENQRLQLWNKAISYTTSLLQKSLENNHKYPVIKNDLHTTITSIANNITSDTPSFIKFTSGFIQPNYITTIKQVIVLIEAEKQYGITNRMKRKRAHIIQIENNETNDDSNNNYDNSNNNHDNNNSNNNIISNCVNNSFNIIRGWVSKVLIEAEKQYGITNRMKRKRAHIIQIENNETNDDSNNNYDNSNNNHDNNNSNNNIISNCVNNSFNIIRGWVSKGIKLLGFRW
ncbi:hypothetical protein Glove_360g41 [Diversispora epigaea]|uniref:Reverse transcriptase domain-containing protein n=1 Tax=Diversispora epigaea TaxID=1348612 RepID=A0A397HA46_9GLOM|nr:hypothetical protein Glove_360g41 [Diversispora epigaea]